MCVSTESLFILGVILAQYGSQSVLYSVPLFFPCPLAQLIPEAKREEAACGQGVKSSLYQYHLFIKFYAGDLILGEVGRARLCHFMFLFINGKFEILFIQLIFLQ